METRCWVNLGELERLDVFPGIGNGHQVAPGSVMGLNVTRPCQASQVPM